MNGPALSAELVIDRGEFHLDIALRAPAGVTALLGPNGSGKSTALMGLAGLHALTSGHVRIGEITWADTQSSGRLRAGLPPELRSVGMVLAEPMLFPHLSLLDNVAYGPRSRGMPRGPARDRAGHELDRVGLGDLTRRRPSEVSSGQAQRAALARALAPDPALLLLDEPLSALDPQTRSRTRADLAARLRDYPGVTVVTTHDPLDALTLADQLIFIEQGRVAQIGSPGEVVARPRTAYVASLVGLNLIAGHLLTGDAPRLRIEGGQDLVLADPPENALAGDRVWATVNPEAVALFTQRPQTSARNLWRLRVESVTVTGQRARVHLDGALPLTADVTLGAVAELGIGRGQELWVAVKATEIHAYPA